LDLTNLIPELDRTIGHTKHVYRCQFRQWCPNSRHDMDLITEITRGWS